MGKYKVEESSEVRRVDHPDYRRNLEIAQNFVIKSKASLLNGMNVKLSNSEHLPNSLLMISWKPPVSAKSGSYATPIFLHQTTEEVNRGIEKVSSIYLKHSMEWKRRHPDQLKFLEFFKKC